MFAKFSAIVLTSLLGALLTACPTKEDAHSSYVDAATLQISTLPSNEERCGTDDYCKKSLDYDPVAISLCDGMSPYLYWNRATSNMLLACECNCTSHDNTGWIIYGINPKIQGVALGKPTTPDLIRQDDKVPDIMASHPMCSAINEANLSDADFVTLIKYPTGDDNSPYCFEARYLLVRDDELRIIEAERELDRSDHEIFPDTSPEAYLKITDIIKDAFTSKIR